MIADMAEFVKNGQEALDQTKDELKKSGYNRKEQGQDKQQDGDAEKKQGDEKQQKQPTDNDQGEQKQDNGKDAGNDAQKSNDEKDAKQEVKESQKFVLTIGQLKKLVAECRTDESFWDKVKGAAKGVAQAAKGVGQSVKQAATNAAQTAKGAAKELGQVKTWTTKVWTSADYADKLSRIIGELNADLKDCGWSAKRNPGLAKVITKIEQDANKIHGQGEHGTQSNLDKIKYAAGKMVGGAVASAAQAAALGVLMAPLRKFMSPRWYAALVAFSTVMLKYFVKKLGDKDLDVDKKEEQAAQAAAPAQAAQPTNESIEVPHIVFEHAMKEAMRAYKRGFAISEDTKITLTIGQLRRLVKEADLVSGVAKDAALDAADAAIFGGAPVLKATEKGAEAYLKNDASVAEEPEPEAEQRFPSFTAGDNAGPFKGAMIWDTDGADRPSLQLQPQHSKWLGVLLSQNAGTPGKLSPELTKAVLAGGNLFQNEDGSLSFLPSYDQSGNSMITIPEDVLEKYYRFSGRWLKDALTQCRWSAQKAAADFAKNQR